MTDVNCSDCEYESDCYKPLKLHNKVQKICKQGRKKTIRNPRTKVVPDGTAPKQ